MKATGVVRRIDDLGRIVIPKEIRRTMRIREGEPMEIFTGREGEIVLKKYSPMGEMAKFAKEYAQVLSQMTGYLVCISDHDQIITASGSGQKDFEGKNISGDLESAIAGRTTILAGQKESAFIKLTDEDEKDSLSQIVVPIISAGDAIGSVVILDRGKNPGTKMGENDKILAQVAAGFLGKQMEQ
ncbi:MAG TPA: AbrB/MazE/SpoVT family DNA-binding domain-containing protein [Candidatus Pelethocola excrementipullorum]|nr:AbrB/MazE/SpoVT family DNA-binding domain-containing protein [Candidatus Pelethocola excrementipullorum]